MRTALVLAAVVLLLLSTGAQADESMYRCGSSEADYLYTNRAELHCPVYAPTGSVVFSAAPPFSLVSRASLWDVSDVEARLASGRTAEPPVATVSACEVYRQFQELHARTAGGTQFQSVEQRRDWVSGVRLFAFASPGGC